MKTLRWFDAILSRIESGFLVLTLGSMVILAFAQVVMRNLFDTGFVWADTIVRHLVLWVGFTGAALAVREERHIGIDALTKFLSPQAKLITRIVTSAFAALVCVFLADAAWTYLKDEQQAGGILVLSIPTWVGILIIPVGYVLLALHFLVKVVQHTAAAFRKTPETP
jgi:TRAP-type C4-dicarboxylate transport system permease small subunit